MRWDLYGAHAVYGTKPSGYEFQLIDDVHHPDGSKGARSSRTGALYGILPGETRRSTRAAGIPRDRRQRNHAEHQNGEKVLEYDFSSPALLQAIRASKIRTGFGFGAKTAGPIVLLDGRGEGVSSQPENTRDSRRLVGTTCEGAGALSGPRRFNQNPDSGCYGLIREHERRRL